MLHTRPYPVPPGQVFMPEAWTAFDVLDGIEEARAIIGEQALQAIKTYRSDQLSAGSSQVHIFDTHGMPGGSFKGASAAVSVDEAISQGHTELVVPSSGSFGKAATEHALNRGATIAVFMPVSGADAKAATIESLGARVVRSGANYQEAETAARLASLEDDAHLLHPYKSTANLRGTAVLAQEIVKRFPGMTDLVLPYGGGSLAGGVAPVVKALKSKTKITLVQVAGCSPAVDTLRTGRVHEAADRQFRGHSFFSRLGGVGVGRLAALNFTQAAPYIDQVLTVWSPGVYATMHDLEMETDILPEFAGAVSPEGARVLARAPAGSATGRQIVSVLTGATPEEYVKGYLASMSQGRRQEDEKLRGLTPLLTSPV